MSKYLDNLIEWVKANKRWTMVIVCVALIAVCWGRLGTTTLDSGLLYFGELIIVGAALGALYYEWRYKTHHLITYDLHASMKNYYDTDSGYRMIPIGSVDSNEFSWNGGQGTVIAPISAFLKIGNEMIGYVRPVPTELSKLPGEVRRRIEANLDDGVGPPYLYAEIPTHPSTLYNAGALFVEQLRAAHPDLVNGGDKEILKNFEKLQAVWVSFVKKELWPKLKKEYEFRDTLAISKIKHQEQEIDFLEKILDGKGEVIVKSADTLAALRQAFKPDRMDKYQLREHKEQERQQ